MEAQRLQLYQVNGRQPLYGAWGVEFVEGVVASLHTAVEKIAGVRGPAIVGDLGVAAVDGEIGGQRGNVIGEQLCAGRGETIEVENVGLRSIRNATERMGEFMKRHTDQQAWLDVSRKGRVAIDAA